LTITVIMNLPEIMRIRIRWLIINFVLGTTLVACVSQSAKPINNLSSSNQDLSITKTIPPLSIYGDLGDLIRDAPMSSTNQNDWEQWKNKYRGYKVKGEGKISGFSVHPNKGKLFVIISELGVEGEDELQIAFLIDGAKTIELGEIEGSININGQKWIFLDGYYNYDGMVEQYSLFDNELVISDFNDLIIIRGALADINEISKAAVYPDSQSGSEGTSVWVNPRTSCEDQPITMWFSPGVYLYKITDDGDSYFITVVQNSQKNDQDDIQCKMPWPNFGSWLHVPPEIGFQQYFQSDFCEYDRSIPPGSVLISVDGIENVTLGDETYQATNVNTFQKYNFPKPPNYPQGSISTSELYVCGFGLINSITTHIGKYQHRDFQSEYELEFISFTPESTNLSHVRYIMVDFQLENLADYYRSNVLNEETAEALRLWEAGIRVKNIDDYERKFISGQWQIVYKGTDQTVLGSDVILTSD